MVILKVCFHLLRYWHKLLWAILILTTLCLGETRIFCSAIRTICQAFCTFSVDICHVTVRSSWALRSHILIWHLWRNLRCQQKTVLLFFALLKSHFEAITSYFLALRLLFHRCIMHQIRDFRWLAWRYFQHSVHIFRIYQLLLQVPILWAFLMNWAYKSLEFRAVA